MASLTARTGVLGHRLAAHLLRRATYHPTKPLIDAYAAKTVAQAINDLMTIQSLTVNTLIDPGTTLPWIDPDGNPYTTGPNVATTATFQLRRYARCWWLDEARLDQSIGHKMEFFLHSIFIVASGEGQPAEVWDHFRLLRHYALGSFKEMAKKMTLDNQMLRYLDNNANNDNNPNENYAREFLELFTIGKGLQVGPGDYTNYTEEDVVQGAKVLTGWKNGDRLTSIDPETGLPWSNPNFNNHEEADKTFSYAFQNTVIAGATDEADMYRELDDYINMIFAQDATALTISRRLYKYFVSRNITAEIESDIIVPLATILRSNNYNLEIAVRALLSSVHFYDEDDNNSGDEVIGSMIKSPLENSLGVLNYFNVTIPDPISDSYNHYNRFYRRCMLDTILDKSGMDIFFPTNVAGYPAYYQEPVFHRSWFTSSTIVSRYKLPEQLISGRRVILGGDLGTVQFNIVPFIGSSGHFSNPGNANLLITELVTYLFCEIPDAARLQYFVDVLTGDFDEAYWTNLWAYYLGSGDEEQVKSPLEDLFKALLYSPEAQIM